MRTAYLLVHIDEATGQLYGWNVYSESASGISKMRGHGFAELTRCPGETFSEARDQVLASLQSFYPWAVALWGMPR